MKDTFLINEASEVVETTAETLRYYDRIGLVRPYRGQNGYRYYSSEQILVLRIIKRLQDLGFSLREVRDILESDDLDSLLDDLDEAIRRCDSSMRKLKETRRALLKAREQYSSKRRRHISMEEMTLPDRYILLSVSADIDSIENLYDYQFLYRKELGDRFDNYSFRDQAGIYLRGNRSSLFIELERVPTELNENVIRLPEGRYLIADCKRDELESKLDEMRTLVAQRYGTIPDRAIVFIAVTGILTWSYRIQIRIG